MIESKPTLAPYSATYSPNLPKLLRQLNCTIAISTYQANKVLFVSAKSENKIGLLPRTFNNAMGIALEKNRMAIATKNEVIVLQNSPQLAFSYPKKTKTYDALFVPRVTYYTGHIDIHDLHFGNTGLWAINTSFSCLCQIDGAYSFTPKWKPPFISELVSEDKCHLNGLAMKDGKPLYVTALGKGDTKQSWRKNITNGGLLMNVQTNEIILDNLAMPHTPRIWDDKLYLLLSASEKLICVNPENGSIETIAHIDGFVRGMAKQGDYIFIATSKLRKESSTSKHLKISNQANEAGIVVLHLPSKKLVGKLTFQSTIDEIYDIKILPNMVNPNILNTYGDVHSQSLHIPNGNFWAQ